MFNQKEYMKLWQKNNSEKLKKYNKQYREDNPEYFKKYQKNYREKHGEYDKEYYQKNREHILEYKYKWRENNLEYIKYKEEWYENNPEYHKQYYRKNKEKLLINVKEYRKTEKGRASHQRDDSKRRATFKEIINTLTSEEWLNILKEYDYKCAYCGCDFDENTLPTRDHVIPISKGGDNTKENIVPACRSCNAKKHNKILIDKEMILCGCKKLSNSYKR